MAAERRECCGGVCWFCRRETEADDVELVLRFALFVICTSCYHYQVGDRHTVSRRLIREITTDESALTLQSLGPETMTEVA